MYKRQVKALQAAEAKQDERVEAAVANTGRIISTPVPADVRCLAGEAKILAKAYHGTPIYGLSNKNREKLNTAISAINWGRAPLMGRERTLSLIYTSFKGGRLAPDVWFLERYVRLARRMLLSHPDRLAEWTRYRAKLRRRLVIQPDFVPVKGCPINVLTDELERNDIRLNDMDLVHDGTCLLYTSPSPRDSGQSRMPSSA